MLELSLQSIMRKKPHIIGIFHIFIGVTIAFAIAAGFRILSPYPAHAATTWVDIKANGSDGPITVPYGNFAGVSWSSFGADSCFVYSYATQWTGTFGFGQTRNITSDQTYSLYCYGKDGIMVDRVRINTEGQFSPSSNVSNTSGGSSGKVLGAGDVVTGPEDTVLWSLGAGFVASMVSYYFFFARREGWGVRGVIRLRKIRYAHCEGEDPYKKEFSRVTQEIKKQEKKEI